MTCILLHNFLQKSSTFAGIYAPQGTFDTYTSDGELVAGSW